MTDPFEIGECRPEDDASIEALYRAAFPDEDLLPLVRKLRASPDVLSLVALVEGELAGHIAFATCHVGVPPAMAALLGPLAVAPAFQGQGVGGALVNAGLEMLEEIGMACVFVLGDPAYYGRFGFEADNGVAPPYPLPDAWRGAWQSRVLIPDIGPLTGSLVVPRPWRQPSLWQP